MWLDLTLVSVKMDNKWTLADEISYAEAGALETGWDFEDINWLKTLKDKEEVEQNNATTSRQGKGDS